jgi:hypothetical protein
MVELLKHLNMRFLSFDKHGEGWLREGKFRCRMYSKQQSFQTHRAAPSSMFGVSIDLVRGVGASLLCWSGSGACNCHCLLSIAIPSRLQAEEAK